MVAWIVKFRRAWEVLSNPCRLLSELSVGFHEVPVGALVSAWGLAVGKRNPLDVVAGYPEHLRSGLESCLNALHEAIVAAASGNNPEEGVIVTKQFGRSFTYFTPSDTSSLPATLHVAAALDPLPKDHWLKCLLPKEQWARFSGRSYLVLGPTARREEQSYWPFYLSENVIESTRLFRREQDEARAQHGERERRQAEEEQRQRERDPLYLLRRQEEENRNLQRRIARLEVLLSEAKESQ